MTTDTPRTEAARERYYDGKTSDWVHYTICRMIEQELAASKAEAARLREELKRFHFAYLELREKVAALTHENNVEECLHDAMLEDLNQPNP